MLNGCLGETFTSFWFLGLENFPWDFSFLEGSVCVFMGLSTLSSSLVFKSIRWNSKQGFSWTYLQSPSHICAQGCGVGWD
jgi:hypothetical protein